MITSNETHTKTIYVFETRVQRFIINKNKEKQKERNMLPYPYNAQ